MAQVKVMGMTDFRGLKSRKDPEKELDYVILHCLVPNSGNGQRNFGYRCEDVFVNNRVVPNGINWTELPKDFIIEQGFNSRSVIRCDPVE